jgi:hypothetical protein
MGFSFLLSEIGLDGRSCNLEGNIRNQRTFLEGLEAGKACILIFWPKYDGVEVSGKGYACKNTCGIRANIMGFYHIPKAGCDDATRGQSREDFKSLYDKQEYEAAFKILSPLLPACAKTMRYIESAAIRNDLAITQFHLGKLSDCRKMLEPLSFSGAKNEDELRRLLPPIEFDAYLPIARATWHNSKLCGKRK